MPAYLIDTHTFLWLSSGSPELSKKAKNLLLSSKNDIYISIASIWEMSIKNSLGKLEIKGGFESVLFDIESNAIDIMPITFEDTLIQNKIPFHHKDPFDRMILSQAINRKMSILGRDELFDDYLENLSIQRIW